MANWKFITSYIFNIDWLALYGAIVGTIALYLNFRKFSRKIKVQSKIHENAQSNVDFLENPKEPLGQSNNCLGPIYTVTVIN
jgi:hypothetical protein